MQMPKLETEKLDFLAEFMAGLITDSDGCLLKKRPIREPGPAQYVWRMVAFELSPLALHHHLPMGAPFYLNRKSGELAVQMDEWNKIVDEICDSQTCTRHGLARWRNLM